MVGVSNNFTEPLEKGVARIYPFNISPDLSDKINVSSMMRRNPSFTWVEPGNYVKLYINGQLMMSDTTMEKRTNTEFVRQAHGSVMIAGLGIGLILENLRPKVESGEVTSITVYEKYQDVIDLVYPRYQDLPLTVHCQDILTYVPPKGECYDTIYFDIWPEICTDNLEDMALLHRRWARRKPSGGWMDSWMHDFLVSQRARERRDTYYW